MESVSAVIGIIQVALDKYDSIQSLNEETKYFRKVLHSVKGVLQDIQHQLRHNKTNTSLSRPLFMLRQAIQEGCDVLEECCRTKKLRARVFSKTYLGKLNTAAGKIKDAMQLIRTSGIAIQGSIQEGLEETSDKIDILQTKIWQQRIYHCASMLLRNSRR